jgi:hypothetical protein
MTILFFDKEISHYKEIIKRNYLHYIVYTFVYQKHITNATVKVTKEEDSTSLTTTTPTTKTRSG